MSETNPQMPKMSETFEEFVSQEVEQGIITAHLFFELGMYSIANSLEAIVKVFRGAGIAFEVVGGVAVNAHIFAKDRSRAFVTRDVNLLLNRTDLELAVKAAKSHGYAAKKIMGGFMLIRPEQKAAEAVHILFVGEKSKSTQAFPHPELRPEEKHMFGLTFPVAPLNDLLQMKLTSFRPKDVTHLEILDELGLITPAMEDSLPSILKQRLTEARTQIAAGKPDIEG